MKSKSFVSLFMLMSVLLMSSVASAAPTLVSPSPNSFGEIERITLDTPADVYSGGVIVVGGVEMILPKNLLIDLPANRLSLQQIFDQAPAACKALGESGLAKADRCNGTGSGGIATLSAVRTNAGNVIVGDLFIQKAAESVHGVVTYINYDQGYYRVNGAPNSATTGAMVRLNDPNSRHTIQSGAGCAGGLNCSPDPRFNLDPDNYTNTFATGYPMCIPSTVARPFPGLAGVPAGIAQATASGTGDLLCPDTNRTATLVEPAVADSRRFAPVKVGDTVLAEGNFETIGGVRFLSAHSSSIQKALSTSSVAGQPDYLFLEEVGYEAPPYQNQRLITLLIGFTTLANPTTDVDLWSLHRDPVNNEIHEFPFASVQGCDNAAGAGTCSNQGLVGAGANIFKIRHDVDFLVGPDPKNSPCAHLLASRFATSHPGICSGAPSTAKDIAVLSPVPHEIIARTGRKITSTVPLITIDIMGNEATNGEYLFPLGLNLGGLGVAEMSEVNINELFTPIPFEGITWNLDRRLGPSGCLNNGGVCEAGAVGSAAFALDPFPFSGLDPRLQATGFPNVAYTDPVFNSGGTTLTSNRNRMFSYVTANGAFNGNNTLIPYVLGSFPADPPLITINPTPALNIFPPVAVGDSATTNAGVPVVIDVLANDVPVFGTIDSTSVLIATGPASGNVAVNSTTGAITFTPTNPAVSNVSFTYTVANNFGSRSLPGTVTVNINNPLPATMITPINASTLAGPSQVFTWNSAVGADIYQIWVGTTQGAQNLGIYPPTPTAATSTTVTLPANGSPIFVRLYSRFGSTFLFNDYTYTSAPPLPATMSTPANATTLAGASQVFTWSNSGASLYQIWVGTTPGAQNFGIFPPTPTAATTATATGLPTNNGPIFVRLYSFDGTAWVFNDYFYKAAAPAAIAAVTSPVNASTLTGTSQTFTWTAAGADLYQIWVGTTQGAQNLGIYPGSPTTATTTAVTLPANGSPIFIRLYSRYGADWLFNDYTYTSNP